MSASTTPRRSEARLICPSSFLDQIDRTYWHYAPCSTMSNMANVFTALDLGGNAGHLDHVIPWVRYPVDFGHNVVLAHDSCSSKKGMLLAAEEHLSRWVEQNQLHGNAIESVCVKANIMADLAASVQIARWAYEQAFVARGMVWIRGRELRLLGQDWKDALP